MKINDFIPDKKQESSGQIIILLAVSLLVLLVVAAMAIDGGMLYSERRFSQNAADASSLAAAAWTANRMADQQIDRSNFHCSSLQSYVMDGFDEAKIRAASNNFSNNFDGADTIFTTDLATYENFGASHENGMIAYCSDADKYIDYNVRLTTETSTAFLHLISPGALKNTVQAITRLEPQRNIAFGNAIVSLNEDCSNTTMGLTISGTSEIQISGGGLWSNSCMRLNGPPSSSSPLIVHLLPDDNGVQALANLIDPDGINLINGTLDPSDAENIVDETMDLHDDAADIKAILDNICNTYTSHGNVSVNNNNTAEIEPGLYDRLTINGDPATTTVTFTNPEGSSTPVYCFDGDVTINGGTVTGNPVVIYMRDGDLSISANAIVELEAPAVVPTYYLLEGLLVFMDPADSNTIALEGGGTSSFVGTIFALNGDVDVGGNSAIQQTYSTQLIGKNVNVHGNVGININFDLSDNVTRAPKLNLLK